MELNFTPELVQGVKAAIADLPGDPPSNPDALVYWCAMITVAEAYRQKRDEVSEIEGAIQGLRDDANDMRARGIAFRDERDELKQALSFTLNLLDKFKPHFLTRQPWTDHNDAIRELVS